MAVYKIKGEIKNYDWGGRSFIQSLIGYSDGRCQAELWFGTHKGGEATLVLNGDALSAVSGNLNFLLKVLSIEKPLSLQCHPNKERAEDGYRRGIYKDPNGKEEMLYALTPVTLVSGFSELERAKENLYNIFPKNLSNLIYDTESHISLFKMIYSLKQEEKEIIFSSALKNRDSIEKEIFCLLYKSYPTDSMILSPYFMNIVKLREGEMIFNSSGTLHSYISGSAIELLSSSDNVVRAGLTEKETDINELLKIGTFKEEKPFIIKKKKEGDLELFEKDDFPFKLIVARKGCYSFSANNKRIVLCAEGKGRAEGEDIKRGEAFFSPSSFTLSSDGLFFIAEEKL